jgi:hypothetical protein
LIGIADNVIGILMQKTGHDPLGGEFLVSTCNVAKSKSAYNTDGRGAEAALKL